MSASVIASGRVNNPRGEGSRLREEIIDAAITLVDQTGDPATLTLRGVARQAGISAPSIYGHFADLPALVAAVLERSFGQLWDTVARGMRPRHDPVSALVGAARAYVRFGSAHPARYRMMFSAGGYAPNAVETFTLVEGAIERCVEAGRSGSTDPHLDAWMVWAALHGLATLDKPQRTDYLRLGTVDRPAMLRTAVHRLARIHA